MFCPVLSPTVKELREILSFAFAIDEDWVDDLSARVSANKPSTDTQRLRALYVIEAMVGLSLHGFGGLQMVDEDLVLNVALPLKKSVEGLQAVIDACREASIHIGAAQGSLVLMGDDQKAKAYAEQSSAAVTRLESIIEACELAQEALTQKHVPQRFGHVLLTFVQTVRSPELIQRLLEGAESININNPISPLEWIKNLVFSRKSSSR